VISSDTGQLDSTAEQEKNETSERIPVPGKLWANSHPPHQVSGVRPPRMSSSAPMAVMPLSRGVHWSTLLLQK
jgi:hypothetical protein